MKKNKSRFQRFITVIPFGVQRFMFYRGRRLYGLLVEVVSRPGVLAAVTSKIAERGLDITYCSTRTVKADERGLILLFIDFTDSEIEPTTLARELEELEPIVDVKLIKPKFEGFISDDVSFPLLLDSLRAIILDETALRGLLVSFREHLGTGGEAMLYHLGVEVGAMRAAHLFEKAESIGILDLGGKCQILSNILTSLGYGIFKPVKLHREPPQAILRVYRSIECELGRGAKQPYSQFIRGMLAGFATHCFKRPMIATETRCIAMGDPYCEFEVKPR